MAKWHGHDAMSLNEKKTERVMIYYASPEGEKYGYFCATVKARRDEFLKEVNDG